MKQVMVIIVCLSIFSQCVMKLGIVAWYQANKGYITQRFCTHKDKPELNCCGKCHLRKELKKVDENGCSKKQCGKTEKVETVAFIIPEYARANLPHFIAYPSVKNPSGQHLRDCGFTGALFRPPCFA